MLDFIYSLREVKFGHKDLEDVVEKYMHGAFNLGWASARWGKRDTQLTSHHYWDPILGRMVDSDYTRAAARPEEKVTEYNGIPEGGAICFRDSISGKEREVLIIRSTKKGNPWLFPKGHVEANETAADCALRELEEETGYVGYIVGDAPVGAVKIQIDNLDYNIEYFLVKVAGQLAAKDLGRKYFWCPVTDALHLIRYPSVRVLLRTAAGLPAVVEVEEPVAAKTYLDGETY
jgi:8-oxo-dGTP pyrophosphatase MutT (NUDIX family)